MSSLVHAAGGVLWRSGRRGRPEVALIHRPRHDDWTLPKGKAKRGEHLLVTALREVAEETGFAPHLGPFLARYSYTPGAGLGRAGVTRAGAAPARPSRPAAPARKQVEYWAMHAGAGEFVANDEVDELVWIDAEAAWDKLSYPLDRKVLRAFAGLPGRTTALMLVRSARAATGTFATGTRPLDVRGQAQAAGLSPLLDGIGARLLFSAPSARCVQTLLPYAAAVGVTVEVDPALRSPGGRRDDSADPDAVARRLFRFSATGVPVAVCTNGSMVDPLLRSVYRLARGVAPPETALRKGGCWLVHVGGDRVVSAERHAAVC
ncbi:MAG: NUDIX hydrolase [Kineosporiaceae bacterium]